MMRRLNSARIEWIDLCKFIGIFYVVWGHSGDSPFIDKYIHTFHMPIFFFLSGFVFNNSKFHSFIGFFINRARAILIPYFTFSIAVYYIWWIFYRITNEPIPVNISTLFESMFSSNTISSPFAAVQWFLTCLFLVELMFYIVVKLVRSNNIGIVIMIILFSFGGYLYSQGANIRLFWGLDTALTGIVFFGIGYLIKNIKSSRINSFIYKPKLFAIVLLLIISLITTSINSTVNMRTIKYGEFSLFYLSAISAIWMYIMIANFISTSHILSSSKFYKVLLYLGKNSIVILLLNQLFIQMVTRTSKQLNVLQGLNINIWGLICSVLVLILMLPASAILNRLAPFAIGKKKIKQNKSLPKEEQLPS